MRDQVTFRASFGLVMARFGWDRPECQFLPARRSGFLELACENPSTVHVGCDGGEEQSGSCCAQGCDNRSTVIPMACKANRESAHYGPTDAHENVHKRTIAIALKNLSCAPSDDRANNNPCQ